MRKLKKGLLLIGPGNYMAHLRLHNEVVGRKKELRECGPGVLLFTGVKGGSLGLHKITFYW